MSKLVLTEEEKALHDWLSLPDEVLGQLMKHTALEQLKADDEMGRVGCLSAAFLMTVMADRANADVLKFTLDGVTNDSSRAIGDWEITVRRTAKPGGPKMSPAVYEAGYDLKLMEYRGWDMAAMERRGSRITIQQIGGESTWWVVMDGTCNALRRPDIEGDPIAFTLGAPQGTRCDTAEEALDLLADYLNQPVNPYTWANGLPEA